MGNEYITNICFYDGHGNHIHTDPERDFVIHGTIDGYNNVTLHKYDWDDLVDAITSSIVTYIAIRLADPDGLLRHEYVFQKYSAEDGEAMFSYTDSKWEYTILVFSNGEIQHTGQLNAAKYVSYNTAYDASARQQATARKNIGAAPKSYILHGTHNDSDDSITLTNFNWDELVAAITGDENRYVAARLVDQYGAYYEEFVLFAYDSEEQIASFQYNNGMYFRSFDLYSDGSWDYYDGGIGYEAWDFTLEDGSTVRKWVAVN